MSPIRILFCLLLSCTPMATFSQGVSGGGSGYTLVPFPAQGPVVDDDLIRELQDFANRICKDGQTPQTDGCIGIGQTFDLGSLLGIPEQCMLDPCTPGCPGAEYMYCVPNFSGITVTEKSANPAETVAAQSFLPAQGGTIAVTTFADGSHEVHQFVADQGYVLVEGGGGAGSHTELLDQIRGQWALE